MMILITVKEERIEANKMFEQIAESMNSDSIDKTWCLKNTDWSVLNKRTEKANEMLSDIKT